MTSRGGITQGASILIVDDDGQFAASLAPLLEANGHTCGLASDVSEARRRLAEDGFDLILCDVNMPGESGIELLSETTSLYPGIAAIMVTAVDDPTLAHTALELGAYGYVIKPFGPSEMLIAIANALRRQGLEAENRRHRENLEAEIKSRTGDLFEAIRRLEHAERDVEVSREETIRRLARAAEFRDEETGWHIERMSRYSSLLAGHIGLDKPRCESIRLAALLHDVGKVGVPDRILRKRRSLSPQEFQIMKTHAEIGWQILEGTPPDDPLSLAATIALCHHERFDGTGYPRGLAGEAIPAEARIASVADAFDALTSDRPYRKALPLGEVLRIMREGRGGQFDPQVLDQFFGCVPEVLAIRESYPDTRTRQTVGEARKQVRPGTRSAGASACQGESG